MKKINDIVRRIYLRDVPLIGGEGIELEVDERKFEKGKYNRDRVVDGFLVQGMGESSFERRMPVIQVDKEVISLKISHRKTYKPQKYYVDRWVVWLQRNRRKIWSPCCKLQYYFVDPISGKHANTIECNWSALEDLLKKDNEHEENLGYYFQQRWKEGIVQENIF